MQNYNSKLKIFTFYIVILIFTFYILHFASAAIVPCKGLDCTFCDFYKLIKNSVDFILKLASVVAGLIILWGGIIILTAQGNSGKISEGRKLITQAVVGFVIMFTGWLVVNLIITSLASGEGGGGSWYQFNCDINGGGGNGNGINDYQVPPVLPPPAV